MMLDFKVVGADEMQAGVTRIADDLHGVPMVDAMRDASMTVLRDAKKLAPENIGHLRDSITPEIRARTNFIEGVVGSNLDYAPYMELGTRAHWPPEGPIRWWVMRKFQLRGRALESVTFLVRRKIARRGLAARRYLQRAYEDNAARVCQIIDKAVGTIISSD